MCGLIGYIGNDKFSVDKIKILMLYNLSRGVHSTGVFTLEDGINKFAISCDKFLANNEIKESNVFIGHTRAATSGVINNSNAHPFCYNDTITAHNGTIKNHWNILSRDKKDSSLFDVDSQVIASYLSEGWQILKDFDGAAAILHYKKDNPDILYAYRNSERPLFRGKYNNGCYFSSLEDSLMAIGCTQIKELKPECLYQFHRNSKIDTTKMVNKPYIKPREIQLGTHVYDSFKIGDYVYINEGYYAEEYGYVLAVTNNSLKVVVKLDSRECNVSISKDFVNNLSDYSIGDYIVAERRGINSKGEFLFDKGDIFTAEKIFWDQKSSSYMVTVEPLNGEGRYTWYKKNFRRMSRAELELLHDARDFDWMEFVVNVSDLANTLEPNNAERGFDKINAVLEKIDNGESLSEIELKILNNAKRDGLILG